MTAEQDKLLTERYQAKRKFLLEYAEGSLHNYALSEEAVQQTFEIACLGGVLTGGYGDLFG